MCNQYYNIIDMNKEIHKIHNYIRDYTKISNDDKAFFIGCTRVRLIIEKKKLEETDYFFAYIKNRLNLHLIILEINYF